MVAGCQEDRHIEWPPYDGWYNNYAHPNWGGAGKTRPLQTLYMLIIIENYLVDAWWGFIMNSVFFVFVETPLLRRLPATYSDGVYEPAGVHRPNPIEISQAVFTGETGKRSSRNRTAFLVFFGISVD